jgi:hypothetical protein
MRRTIDRGVPGLLMRMAAVGAALFLMLSLGCSFQIDYDSYALVYGISEYYPFPPGGESAGQQANDLSACHQDAIEMAALFASKGFNVITREDEPDVSSPDVTIANIQSDIAAVAAQAGPDDLFVFFFSGHGDFYNQGDEPPGSQTLDEALILNETNDWHYLVDDDLADLIKLVPCRRRVVIIDTCFSGGLIGSGVDADRIPPNYDYPASQPNGLLKSVLYLYANYGESVADIAPQDALVLAASGELEYSYEKFTKDNGVFTDAVLRAAEWGDRNRDGFLTVLEAYAYARSYIEATWNVMATAFSPHVSGGPMDYVLFPVP